jgi:hypothetical protein
MCPIQKVSPITAKWRKNVTIPDGSCKCHEYVKGKPSEIDLPLSENDTTTIVEYQKPVVNSSKSQVLS